VLFDQNSSCARPLSFAGGVNRYSLLVIRSFTFYSSAVIIRLQVAFGCYRMGRFLILVILIDGELAFDEQAGLGRIPRDMKWRRDQCYV
jgi:hypothetical protein